MVDVILFLTDSQISDGFKISDSDMGLTLENPDIFQKNPLI